MILYFKENPHLLLVLIAVIIFTLWLCIKAGVASKKHYNKNADLMAKIKEETQLIKEFAELSPSLIANADPAKLFKGIGLNLQKRVAKRPDIMAEFNSLTDEQKSIYALYTVIDDGKDGLSGFFKGCTHPLTDCAKTAVKDILDSKAAAVFAKEFNAYDDDNENVSLIPAEISKLDEEFAELAPIDVICEKAGNYIKENAEKFL